MTKINKIHFIYAVWLALAAFLFLLTGCETINESSPVKGGSYTVSEPFTGLAQTLVQSDNAKSPSTLSRTVRVYDASGYLIARETTDVTLGTSRDPIITERKGHPNEAGQYTLSIIGALAILAGVVVGFKMDKRSGIAIGLGGLLVAVLGLTVGQYGWIYAIVAALGIAGYLYHLHRQNEAAKATTAALSDTNA